MFFPYRALRPSFRRFHRDERGGVAVMSAIMMSVLFLVAGMAIDGQRAFLLKVKLQQIADSAILAAGAESESGTVTVAELQAIASRYLAANPIPPELATVSFGNGEYDEDSRVIELRLEGMMETSLLKIAGIETITTTATARALKTVPGPMELAIALDATGSMAFPLPGSTKNKMQAVQEQVSALIERLKDYSDARIAIVPFYMYSRVPVANDNASWMKASTRRSYQAWSGYVGVRSAGYRETVNSTDVDKYPYIYPAGSVTEMVPLTSAATGSATLLAALNATSASGSSFVPMGLIWAWNMLTPEAPFTEAKTRAEMEALGGRKILMVITDGGNNVAPQPDGTLSISGSIATSNTIQANLCTNAKAEGIEIYAVNYLDNNVANQELLRNCATDDSRYFNVTNASELENAFQNITSKMTSVRLLN